MGIGKSPCTVGNFTCDSIYQRSIPFALLESLRSRPWRLHVGRWPSSVVVPGCVELATSVYHTERGLLKKNTRSSLKWSDFCFRKVALYDVVENATRARHFCRYRLRCFGGWRGARTQAGNIIACTHELLQCCYRWSRADPSNYFQRHS